MYITSVPGNRASASQSSAVASLAGSSWPVTNATAEASSRWVTGDPRVCGPGHAGGDAGDDLELHRRRAQGLRLLPAAPEDERVAALQAHHGEAPPRALDQLIVDPILSDRCVAGLLADVEELRVVAAPARAADGIRRS